MASNALSRGSVYIQYAYPAVCPAIDPNFFLVDYDLDVHVALTKFVRRFFDTKPLKDWILKGESPGLEGVPDNATDAEWAKYIKMNFGPAMRGFRTCAMMKSELGGVVDTELRVYGTGMLVLFHCRLVGI